MNQSLALGLVLSLVDRISGPLKAIERAQDSYNKSLNKLDAGLLKTSRSWDIFVKSIGKAGAPYLKVIEQANQMTQLGQKMALRGAAGVAVGLAPTIDAASFEKAMAEVATLTDMSVADFKAKYSRGVLDLSAEIGQAPEAVAKGMDQAISAGYSADDSIEFMRNQGKAAVAGVSDLFTSVDLATTIKNAYGIPITDMAKYNDMVFQSVRKGKTTFAEIGQNFSKVGAQAAGAGVSFANVQAMVAQMTLEGNKTAVAYTSLRYVIDALAAPGNEAKKVFQGLGIEMNAEVLRKNDLAGSLDLITQKMAGMSEAARADALSKIFGSQEAMLLVNSYMQKSDKYKEMVNGMLNSTGEADKAYKKMSGTTAMHWDRAVQAFKGVRIALGDSLLPVVNIALDLFTGIAKIVTHVAQNHKILTGVVMGGAVGAFALVAALGALLIVFGLVTKATVGYRIAMRLIATQKGPVLTAIRGITDGVLGNIKGMGGGITSILPKILSFGWITIALAGAYVLVKKYWQPISAFFKGIGKGLAATFAPFAGYFKPIWEGLSKLWEWLTNLGSPIKLNEDAINRWIEAGKTVGKVIAIIGGVTLLFTPLGWLAVLLFGIAWVIKKHWEPTKAFITGFLDSFSAGLVPLNDGLSVMSNTLSVISPLLDAFYNKMVQLGIIKDSEKDVSKFAKAGKVLGNIFDWLNYMNPLSGPIMGLGLFKEAYNSFKKIQVPHWLNELADGLLKLLGLFDAVTKAMGYVDKIFGVAAPVDAKAADAATKAAAPTKNAAKATDGVTKAGFWSGLFGGVDGDTGAMPDFAGAGATMKAADEAIKAAVSVKNAAKATDGVTKTSFWSGLFGGVDGDTGAMPGFAGTGAAMPKMAMAGGDGRGATITFNGGINITIPGTNASPGDVAKAVQDGIEQALRKAW